MDAVSVPISNPRGSLALGVTSAPPRGSGAENDSPLDLMFHKSLWGSSSSALQPGRSCRCVAWLGLACLFTVCEVQEGCQSHN